ncbi:MAG: tRNA pseudouridine(38-40) synthase TruA [Aromatoleum sp.]|nr:tRNA pseudouridine(38-40) synthase TruA [Aromatoleum sp.]
MRLALGLEYTGVAFTGWQSQPDGRGVQDALEQALGAIVGTPVGTIAAGRTDARVHATMQIVHFDSPVARPDTAWVRGVNSHLPVDVAVQWVQPVADDFHARFAATARHYTYLVANRPVRPALLAGRVGWYHRPLDVAAMARAARVLAGTHDFSAFRAAECQAKSPVKTVTVAAVAVDGDCIRFEFSANAFLHHMIRNIVGALVYVGAAKAPETWIAELLAGRDRTRAAPTFAPDGLYLTGADYDAIWGLPSTRRRLPTAIASARA